MLTVGFPGDAVVKNVPANAEDTVQSSSRDYIPRGNSTHAPQTVEPEF